MKTEACTLYFFFLQTYLYDKTFTSPPPPKLICSQIHHRSSRWSFWWHCRENNLFEQSAHVVPIYETTHCWRSLFNQFYLRVAISKNNMFVCAYKKDKKWLGVVCSASPTWLGLGTCNTWDEGEMAFKVLSLSSLERRWSLLLEFTKTEI